MATNQTLSPVLNSEWTRSTAVIPKSIPPYPSRWSDDRHRWQSAEPVGAGRLPLNEPRPKSTGLAFVLSVLFGPVGLCYVSATAGLVATVSTAVILLVAGAGFVPLLVIWPLSVLGSVWGAGHVHVSG